MPTDFISRLPRVEVIFDHSSPVAGSAHWDGHDWIIIINARKREPARRFSLAHELKHVIDHTTRAFLYTGMPRMTATEQAERAADYFTGCLLMPSLWLKQASRGGCRTADEFARRFHVPLHTAEKRLTQIGLAPEQTRQLQLINDTAVDPHIELPIGAEA